MLPAVVTRRITDAISAEMGAFGRALGSALKSEIRQLARRGMIGSDQTATHLAGIGASDIETRAAMIWQAIRRAHEAAGCPVDEATLRDLQREVANRINGQLAQVQTATTAVVPPLPGNLRTPLLEHITTTLATRAHEQVEKFNLEADFYVASLQRKSPQPPSSAPTNVPSVDKPRQRVSISRKVLELVHADLSPKLAQLHRHHIDELAAIARDPVRRGNHARSRTHGRSIFDAICRAYEQRAIAIRDSYVRALPFQDGAPLTVADLGDAFVEQFESQRQEVLEHSRIRLSEIAGGTFIGEAVTNANQRIAWLRAEAEHVAALDQHQAAQHAESNGLVLGSVRVRAYGRVDSRADLDRAIECRREIERFEQILPSIERGVLVSFSVSGSPIGTYLSANGHAFSVLTEEMMREHFKHELQRRSESTRSPSQVVNFNAPVSTAITGEHANVTINVDQGQRDAMFAALDLIATAFRDAGRLASEDRARLLEVVAQAQTETRQKGPDRARLQGLFTTLCMTLQTLAATGPAMEALRVAAVPFGIVL